MRAVNSRASGPGRTVVGSILVACLCALALPGLVAEAQQGKSSPSKPAGKGAPDTRFDLVVRNDFFLGFGGDKAALARGMKACDAVLAKNPRHAEALVWHGSGLMFEAGEVFQKGDFQRGLEIWNKAIKEMDDAVAIAPGDVGVRIPRGAVLIQSSRFVRDQQQQKLLVEKSLSDFEKVYELQKADLGKLGVHPRGELLFGLAESARRLGKEDRAREYLQLVLSTCKDSAYEKEAKEWLAKSPTAAEPSLHSCIGCHTGS